MTITNYNSTLIERMRVNNTDVMLRTSEYVHYIHYSPEGWIGTYTVNVSTYCGDGPVPSLKEWYENQWDRDMMYEAMDKSPKTIASLKRWKRDKYTI